MGDFKISVNGDSGKTSKPLITLVPGRGPEGKKKNKKENSGALKVKQKNRMKEILIISVWDNLTAEGYGDTDFYLMGKYVAISEKVKVLFTGCVYYKLP